MFTPFQKVQIPVFVAFGYDVVSRRKTKFNIRTEIFYAKESFLIKLKEVFFVWKSEKIHVCVGLVPKTEFPWANYLKSIAVADMLQKLWNKPAPCGNGMGLADIRTKQAFIWIFGELFRHVRKLNPWIKMKFGYKIKNFINICKTVHRCTVCFLIVHMQIIWKYTA